MLTTRYDAVLALVFLLVLSFVGCTRDEQGDGTHRSGSPGVSAQADAADYYTCPMHPSVRSDKPGACPVCGMALVKKSGQAGSLADTALLQTVSLSPSQRVIANVTTVPVERRALSRGMHVVGVVAAAEPLQATVAARFRGRLEKLFVNATGQRVRKGEPLFELYSPDLISAERDFLLALQAERGSGSSGITGTGSMQRQLLDASRDRLRVHFGLTEAQIEGLERSGQTGSSARFFSPISGTVLQKAVQQGMYVDEGMTLYQLADLSRVWAYLDVYERDLAMVKEGQSIGVTTEAYPGRTFTGRVTFVDPVVDPATRTVRVRTELPNGEGLLKPNMFVRARLSAAGDPGLVVPRSAVLSTGPRTVVWVEIRKNEFEPREVAIGAADSGLVQVLHGLHEGEMVAQTGGFLIDSESALMMPPSSGQGLQAGHPQGHVTGNQPATAGGVSAGNATAGDSRDGNKATIIVDGRYIPDVVRVKRNLPVRLEFVRRDKGACTDEVVFEALDIRRSLPEGATTVIELPAQKPGEIHYACGMGMLHGTVIVE